MSGNGRFAFSHMELYVTDMAAMRAFYEGVLGFTVTDEGGLGGERRLLFLSRDPGEHHQLVFSTGRPAEPGFSVLNHISFRVENLVALREVWRRVSAAPHGPVEQVTHGISWSVYFRDPEGNRVECFVDTPWYTPQPCREPIDFARSDAEILQETEALCRERPGFRPRAEWQAELAGRFSRQG